MRLVFLGTPEAAVPSLRALVGAGHDVALVVSRADARRARRGAAVASPVKAAAVELGLPVSDRPGDAVGVGAEVGVVVAYGRLVRPEVLAQVYMVNAHFSLLPRWRGAAPVERAILAGDELTGVCVMALEETLDTGAVHRRAETLIGPGETADALRARLAVVGAELLVETLAGWPGPDPVPQDGEVTYAAKIEQSDRHLDWAEPTGLLLRRVRVGRAWTTLAGDRLLVLSAIDATDAGRSPGPGVVEGDTVGTGDGAVRLGTVQPAGRRPLPAGEWLRGVRLPPGTVLGAAGDAASLPGGVL